MASSLSLSSMGTPLPSYSGYIPSNQPQGTAGGQNDGDHHWPDIVMDLLYTPELESTSPLYPYEPTGNGFPDAGQSGPNKLTFDQLKAALESDPEGATTSHPDPDDPDWQNTLAELQQAGLWPSVSLNPGQRHIQPNPRKFYQPVEGDFNIDRHGTNPMVTSHGSATNVYYNSMAEVGYSGAPKVPVGSLIGTSSANPPIELQTGQTNWDVGNQAVTLQYLTDKEGYRCEDFRQFKSQASQHLTIGKIDLPSDIESTKESMEKYVEKMNSQIKQQLYSQH
ncbi:hypothetical protein BJ085DRAFT_31273 [Dimargaris cristalligena]|uniref:Uncharacterized protein n=1 Tax=Dimargaris cristalligena TaxID=215637 RepID=A0A4P9ZJH8_9FUNG|nr:hypothetical protein BJ085DRAFT_31273 [Dimargaris cristalligena]|eukprot:RKP33223.1 hypothetical protein BJ085DRAFT_31273 [Dimargaris cristalligena]